MMGLVTCYLGNHEIPEAPVEHWAIWDLIGQTIYPNSELQVQ